MLFSKLNGFIGRAPWWGRTVSQYHLESLFFFLSLLLDLLLCLFLNKKINPLKCSQTVLQSCEKSSKELISIQVKQLPTSHCSNVSTAILSFSSWMYRFSSALFLFSWRSIVTFLYRASVFFPHLGKQSRGFTLDANAQCYTAPPRSSKCE